MFGSLVCVRQVDFDEKDLGLKTVVDSISQASWVSESIKLTKALWNALRCSKNALNARLGHWDQKEKLLYSYLFIVVEVESSELKSSVAAMSSMKSTAKVFELIAVAYSVLTLRQLLLLEKCVRISATTKKFFFCDFSCPNLPLFSQCQDRHAQFEPGLRKLPSWARCTSH